jgi:predicted kinase
MYTYNGENYTLDEMKMVLGVEEITEAIMSQYGITLAEEEATQIPDESKTVVENKGFFSDDFQEVAATEDVPAVTEKEVASKPIEEMPTSELELQLEDTSLAIAEIEKDLEDFELAESKRIKGVDPKIEFKRGPGWYTELQNLKRKKEKVSNQLQVRYTGADKIDFSKPESVASQLEDRVVTELRAEHGYPYLNVEATGAGNEVVIKNYLGTGKNVNVKLDGSDETKKVFKDLNDYDKALTDTSRVSLTIESSLNKLSKDNNIVPLNKVIKDLGYEIQQVETPGKSITTGYGPGGVPITDYTPATYEYSLTKDGVTIASDVKGISDILKGDKKIEGAVVQAAYDIQTQNVKKRAQAIKESQDVITKDPTTTVDYYEDGSFEKDIVKAIQDKGLDLSPDEIKTIQEYFKSINARVGGVEVQEGSVMAQFPSLLKMAGVMGFVDESSSKNYISDKEKVEIYRNLSGLPSEVIEKIKASGFLPTVKKKVAEIAYQKTLEKSETIFEDLIKAEGDQEIIQTAQRFIGADVKDTTVALEKRADKVVEQREKQATVFSLQAQNIIENIAPEGARIGLMAAGGSSQLGLQVDRKLTKEEQKQFDKASDMLMDLQYSMDLSQQDYINTINNIQKDFQIYAAENKGVDQGLFNTASKEYGLNNLLVKDVNDSFASLLLSVPTLLDSDWANLEQQKINRKNNYYETARAYDDGDFGRYVLRTTAQQSANIVTAIATGGAASGLGLGRMASQLAIGTVFGVSSGTQTFRDLSSQNTIYDLAKLRGEQATRAKAEGIIGDFEYTQIMQDVNNTLAMGRLSNTQVMGAAFTNGVIEGSVMTLIGQAPNTLKLLKDFKNPTQTAEIAKNLFSKYGKVGQLYNYIGKPLVTRPLGEVIEEGAVYGLQQYVTEYGILDRELDLSQWDDTAMAAITTSGLTQSPGIAYSGMITYGKTKQYEKAVNSLRNINTNLSQLIQNTKNESDRETLLNDMSGILEEMGLETDMLSIDILNLGAKDVKRLIGNSLIKQDVLARAGVPPGSSEVKTAEILNAYKATLSPQEVEDFDNQLSAIDTQVSRIKEGIEKPGSYKLAKQSLGNIYTQYNSRFEEEGVVFKNDREKLAKIVQRFRQDMVDSNLEQAKKDKDIVKIVESKRTEDGKELNEAQKEALYASYGQMLTETKGRAVASRVNLDTAVNDIFEKGSNVDVVAWKTEDDLRKVLDEVTVLNEETGKKEKLSKKDYNDAYSKLLNNETFGLIVGNKLITQNETEANADLQKGIIRAGTVKLHELTHVINDGRITTKKGKADYANNLFEAASTSKNLALQAAHEQVIRDLNDIYESRKMTFENSEEFRDEYTTHLQEKLYANEDQLQLEKDEGFLVRAFNDLTTNANSLNTPERALNFLLANNSGFRNGKLSRKSQRAIKNRDSGKLKTSEKNTVNKLAVEYKENKDTFMKNPEQYGDLFMQFQSVALDAMGYNVGKGDIAAADAMGFVATEFESIMRNYKPVVDGKNTAFTTYVTNVFKMGRGNKFYKQELGSKEGRVTITDAGENRLLSTDTAESGLELEERKAKEAKARRKLINPLSAKEIGTKKKAIEDAVIITPAMAPIADFKSISKDYGGKVAGIIFDIPEAKITDGTKNLTYAKKIVDGVPEPSEAGNIQNLYSDTQVLARDIRLLPDTNVTSEESRVGEQGEKVPVTRDVQGRSLGLPNRIIKYFYEDTGKRSKGTTSQTKVYKKKAKFDNPTPQVLKEVQREMGITPAGQLNQYDRTIGQFLKGFARVKGSVAAVAVAKNKVARLDTKTSKGVKQIEADIGAGRSKVQFSEKSKQRVIDLRKAAETKTGKLTGQTLKNFTVKQLQEKGLNTIADIKNKLGLPLRDGDDVRINTKAGFKVLEGNLELTASVLNDFIKQYPEFYESIRTSTTSSLRKSMMGSRGLFDQLIEKPSKRYPQIVRQNYKRGKNQGEIVDNNFVKKTKSPDYIKDQYSKLDYFEKFWKSAESYLKTKPENAWVFEQLLNDAQNDMGSLTRIAPPILYLPILPNGDVNYKVGVREEHNFPANNIGSMMLWSAMNGQVDNAMKLVSATYMQGPITLDDDLKLDVDFKFNMPDIYWNKIAPRILSGDLKTPEGLASVIRLTESGVNLDQYLFLPENKTMSEYLFGTNGVPSDVQARLTRDFLTGEITLEESRKEGKKAVAIINKLNESFKPDSSKVIEFNNTADRAMANARNSVKYSEKPVKARVFDFDDTLAQSNSMVIVNKPNPEGGFSEGTTKLKAIFMVGGPGAGKTNVGKGLQLGRRGYKVVNQDIALEAMKSEAGLPGDESGYTAEQRSMRSKLGFAARKAATAKFDKYADAGNGMVIDGTGASYNATTKKIKELQDKGFEVHMVVANTPLETALERNKARKERSLPDFVVRKTYDQVQESLAKYKQDFGGRLYEINTENIQYGKPLPKDFLDQVYAGINSTKVERINATEFALEAGNLEQQGATFNFSEFNQVIDGKKGPLFDVAKMINDSKGERDMFVLTARPAASAPNIKEFLDGLGLNIPLENIVGLGDGKAQAKADWFIQKYSEGYNDFYFADDALKNVKAVKDIFNVLDVKSQVQQARVKFSEKISTEFNDMIERNKGIKSQATFSDVQARRRGTKQKKYSFFIPPSADDFRGLTQYTFAGKGKQGEADQEFFDKALIKPYQAGVAAINRAKFRIRTDYGTLVKNNKKIAKRLKNEVAGTNHTLDEAIRVYLWNKEGYDIPGMSKRDVDALVGHVESGKNGELIAYAEGVKLVTRKDAYPEPTEFWDGSTILGDLNSIATETNRAEYLKEFIDNSKIIFSEQNLNKVEAVYGFRVRESIENILFRMETGQNKAKGSGRIVNEWNDWVNNSVGAIMFFNRRSALMQTLSTVNFVNWSDNNPIKAAAAFANQPQYWKDFITLWSSPKLVARRKGLESDIQEAEIARAAKKGGVKGVISYLLKIGFTPTQLADSFAIASGGATFYRNRIKSYLKETNDQGEKVYTKEQAEQKAFEDFSSTAEETQQSGDPMLVSQQQASVLGRLVLAFQNTPMQYTRLIKKAGQDLINRRGNPMTSMSKIVYYGFVQNLIFSTLQNALFALIPGFDDDEEDFKTDKEREKYLEKQQRKEDGKVVRVANSMIDTLLRGSGLAGAVVSTIKNVIMAYQKYDEAPMIQKENADIILAALNISPPIGSKARKINNVLQTMQFEKDVLAERGFSVMIDGHFQLSPAYDMLGDATSATLNLPLDRLADEVNAITEALDTRNTQWQRIALALGWRQWDVGARAEEHDLIKTEAKAKRKIEGKEKAKETRAKNKELKIQNGILYDKVLSELPRNIGKELQDKVISTRQVPPVFILKELAEKYNIDISDYE